MNVSFYIKQQMVNYHIGQRELIDTRDGNSLETFDTFKEAELQLEREVRTEFEGLIE